MQKWNSSESNTLNLHHMASGRECSSKDNLHWNKFLFIEWMRVRYRTILTEWTGNGRLFDSMNSERLHRCVRSVMAVHMTQTITATTITTTKRVNNNKSENKLQLKLNKKIKKLKEGRGRNNNKRQGMAYWWWLCWCSTTMMMMMTMIRMNDNSVDGIKWRRTEKGQQTTSLLHAAQFRHSETINKNHPSKSSERY